MAGQHLGSWQNRLVPVMVGMIVFASLFFAVVSFIEFERIQSRLTISRSSITSLMANYDLAKSDAFEQQLQVADRKANLALEAASLSHRYEQAHAVIIANLWTRFMAFITGTLMALIGSAFILGRIRETENAMSGSGGGIAFSLTTASPGIVLAVLGSVLILAAVFSRFKVETSDYQGTPKGQTIPEEIMQNAPGSAADIALPPSPLDQAK